MNSSDNKLCMAVLACTLILAGILSSSTQVNAATKTGKPVGTSKPATLKIQYFAETIKPSVRQGVVAVKGRRWLCHGNRCTVTGPWPVPDVASCMALAAQVGPIRSFGHLQQRLTVAQLRRCNSAASQPGKASVSSNRLPGGVHNSKQQSLSLPAVQSPVSKSVTGDGKLAGPKNLTVDRVGRVSAGTFAPSANTIPGGRQMPGGDYMDTRAPPQGAADAIRAGAAHLRNRPTINSYYDERSGRSLCVANYFEIRGRNFGDAQNGKNIFMLDPRDNSRIRLLSVLTWSDDKILVASPEPQYFRPGGSYAAGIFDADRRLLSNVNRDLHFCPDKFTVSGTIQLVNCDATAANLHVNVTTTGDHPYTIPATVTPSSESRHMFVYKADVAAHDSVTINIEPQLRDISCPGGTWSPAPGSQTLSFTHTQVKQSFAYRVPERTLRKPLAGLVLVIDALFHTAQVHINNYDPANHTLKTGDSFIKLPEDLGGQRLPLEIPPLVNGPRKYYINDVNLASTKVVQMGNEIKLIIKLENNGTEFIGTCGEDGFDAGCAIGAPDVEANLEIYAYFSLDKFQSRDVPSGISYNGLRVIARDNAQADGVCHVLDFMCSAFNNYRVQIRRGLQTAVYSVLNNDVARNEFAKGMQEQLDAEHVGVVKSVRIDGRDLVITYLPAAS